MSSTTCLALPSEGGTVMLSGKGADYRIDDNGCWVWQRSVDAQGYGRVTGLYPERRAHRLYFHIANGRVPEGLSVHHRCRVRRCVNPAHLEAIDHHEHMVNHGERWMDDGEVIAEARACRRCGKPVTGHRGRRYCSAVCQKNYARTAS